MNDGPPSVGGEGTKSKSNNNNIINNLMGSRSSSGSNSSAAADAKEEEDVSNGGGEDHQMLDLSMGRREGNCDKLTEKDAKKSMENEVEQIKKDVAGDQCEAEVDDGIGEEVVAEKELVTGEGKKEKGTVI